MSVINTNIKSLITQNNLTVNNRALSSAMEKLSTGKRINSASDDAAGLAISNKMTAQIRGLNQSVRNANDGISMVQTAEGALTEVTNMLQRMRELAVQAANDTYTPDDRQYLQLEYQQLVEEMSRITSDTEWNGMKVLGADGKTYTMQIGANDGQVLSVDFKDLTSAVSDISAAVDASLVVTGSSTLTKMDSAIAAITTYAVIASRCSISCAATTASDTAPGATPATMARHLRKVASACAAFSAVQSIGLL